MAGPEGLAISFYRTSRFWVKLQNLPLKAHFSSRAGWHSGFRYNYVAACS